MEGSPLIASKLSSRLGEPVTVIGEPAPAINSGWQDELSAAAGDLDAMAKHLHSVMSLGAITYTALSRCSVALATLPVVARHHPDAVVLWFDAHPDLNTPETSTSGYLGGLALSGALGWWDSGLGSGLSEHNTILVGARDIDPQEQRLLDRSDLTLLAPGPNLTGRLAKSIRGRSVYVHIDCDVLGPKTVPTDYEVPGGLSLAELKDLSSVIAEHHVVGVEVGEFESGSTPLNTERAAQRLLNTLDPLLRSAQLPK
ncbi:arginase family protein [Nesterenkonia muleiensis]|uniref:arginase family protein n=1 Tax=Nesterenkonia muleiensis TaxID=2282648 RepID=UPI00192E3301|nr:arginase family protein [Nesterenkonia muleiensis]